MHYKVTDNLTETVIYDQNGDDVAGALGVCNFTTEPPNEDYQIVKSESSSDFTARIWQDGQPNLHTEVDGTVRDHTDVTAAKARITTRDEAV